jgi:aspartate/glutamate racemase
MRDDRTPVLPLQLDPDLLRAAQWLGTTADFLVITANGPHALQDQIEHAAGCNVLSLIAITLQDVQRRGRHTVGVLGFSDPMVSIYTRRMRQFNLTFETIEAPLRVRLDEAIWALMEGRESAEATACA